ncbi:type IV pilus assembly protein PilV [Sphaerotilus hippei]|uniref:Type IV pilus assembly protein PilV n=1 Tax=Sphaerotilus hippei TaxID=744406 RepID=A0A318H0K3_9BURK|nr:type IV pilus modification protein PilV [Sphaerotilus hippei]PXW96261.1 type IV pilus assembly protein PilV [Sphaerotilus hippei]
MTLAPPPSRRPAGARRHQRGVSLIEALIAFLLLSIGVLGMAALHARAIQYAVDGEDRNRAALLASELSSQMWTARTTSLPAATITAWTTRVQTPTASGLPNATATVGTPDANGVVSITITWRPPARPSNEGSFRYITKVAL